MKKHCTMEFEEFLGVINKKLLGNDVKGHIFLHTKYSILLHAIIVDSKEN